MKKLYLTIILTSLGVQTQLQAEVQIETRPEDLEFISAAAHPTAKNFVAVLADSLTAGIAVFDPKERKVQFYANMYNRSADMVIYSHTVRIAYRPDGEQFVTVGNGKMIFWHWTGKVQSTVPDMRVGCLEFSPDSKYLVICQPHAVIILDNKGKRVTRIGGLAVNVNGVAFHPKLAELAIISQQDPRTQIEHYLSVYDIAKIKQPKRKYHYEVSRNRVRAPNGGYPMSTKAIAYYPVFGSLLFVTRFAAAPLGGVSIYFSDTGKEFGASKFDFARHLRFTNDSKRFLVNAQSPDGINELRTYEIRSKQVNLLHTTFQPGVLDFGFLSNTKAWIIDQSEIISRNLETGRSMYLRIYKDQSWIVRDEMGFVEFDPKARSRIHFVDGLEHSSTAKDFQKHTRSDLVDQFFAK